MHADFYIPKKYSSFSRIRTIGLIAVVTIFFLVRGPYWVSRGIGFTVKFFPSSRLSEEDEMAFIFQAKISDLDTQNEKLQQLFSDTLANAQRILVPAHISLGDGYLFVDTFMIDRGTDAGIVNGNAVIAEGVIVVGTVVVAEKGWSKVALLSRLGNKVVLRGSPLKDIVFEATGIGGGELEAELPSSVSLGVGDVVWWGERSEYILGIVDRVNRTPERQIQTIVVRTPRSLKTLLNVAVVLR